MPFLVIAGITVPVAPNGAQILAPERVGSSARAFDGSLRTTVRDEKKAWRFRTPARPPSTWAALKDAIDSGTFVTCSGDALGASFTCEVMLGDSDLVQVAGGFREALTLTLRQV